jgi:hypothetical protein
VALVGSVVINNSKEDLEGNKEEEKYIVLVSEEVNKE